MNLTTPPPAKLSDLLDLAIADARRLDRDRYTPTAITWHRPDPLENKCMVCLAGSVIAGTLGCEIKASIEIVTSDNDEPQSTAITDKRWRHALWALDAARGGDWLDAFKALHGCYPEGELYDAVEAVPTPEEPEFHDWKQLDAHLVSLGSCASELRELGL